MLLNWFMSSVTDNSHLNNLINIQDLKNIGIQYCTHLLAAGVLRQISDKDAPTENIFKPNLMYYWAHMDAPTLQPITPGKLQMLKWPPERDPLLYNAQDNTLQTIDNNKSMTQNNNDEINNLNEARATISQLKRRLHELEIELEKHNITAQIHSLNSDIEKSFNELERDNNKNLFSEQISVVNKETQTLNGSNEILDKSNKTVINLPEHDSHIRTNVNNDIVLDVSTVKCVDNNNFNEKSMNCSVPNDLRSENLENYCKLNKSRDFNVCENSKYVPKEDEDKNVPVSPVNDEPPLEVLFISPKVKQAMIQDNDTQKETITSPVSKSPIKEEEAPPRPPLPESPTVPPLPEIAPSTPPTPGIGPPPPPPLPGDYSLPELLPTDSLLPCHSTSIGPPPPPPEIPVLDSPPPPPAMPEMVPSPPPMPGVVPTPLSMPGVAPPPPPMPGMAPPSPPMSGLGPPPPPMSGLGPPPPPMSGLGPPPPPMPGLGPPPPLMPGMGPPPPPMPGMGPPPPPMPGMGPPPPPMPGLGPAPPPMPGACPAPPPPPPIGLSQAGPGPPPPPPISGPVPFPAPPVGGWNPQRATLRKKPIVPVTPMKPLYWTRILAPTVAPAPTSKETESSPLKPLWLEIEETNLDNIDEFTDLFSRQVVKAPVKKKVEVKTKLQPVKILDSKRSQNVGILAQSLNVPFSEIENAVYNFDTSVISLEALHQIYELRATNEEITLIKQHLQEKPDIPLDKPETFLHDLSTISNFSERISCFMFQAEFEEAISTIMHKLDNLKHTCEFLMKNEHLKKLFAIILTLGNYMNGGNGQRGQADGFGLEILPKLKDVKSKQSNVTLLHFIVRTYTKRCGGVLSESCVLPVPEPGDVTRAAALDFASVAEQLKLLEVQLKGCQSKTKKIIDTDAEILATIDEAHLADHQKRLDVFKDKMTSFLQAAEEKIKTENENLQDCRNKFMSTVKFYQYTPRGCKLEDFQPEDFFSLWTSFCSDFKDIYKKEEQIAIKDRLKEAKKQRDEKRTSTQPKKEGGLKARLQKLSSTTKKT